jgi:hypothetical protein
MTHHRNYSEAKRKRALKTLSKVAMVDNKKEFNKVELGPQDYFKSEQKVRIKKNFKDEEPQLVYKSKFEKLIFFKR